MVKGVRLLDRRIAARRRRARRRHRRDAVDAQRERRRARRGGAAAVVRARARLLVRRRVRRSHPLRDAGLPVDRAERAHRRAGRLVRREGRCRSQERRRSGDGSRHRRDRTALDADRREERRDRRRRAQDRRQSEEPAQRKGIRPRVRRPHRQAALDLPHDSARRRVRARHVGKGFGLLHRQHRRVGADLGGRRARPRLPAGRTPDRRLLRRSSSRQRPVRREPRRRRSADRQAPLALSAGPSRDLGLRHPVRADPRRHYGERPHGEGGRPADEAGMALRLQP